MSIPMFEATPNLKVNVAGKEYSIPPPTKEVGLALQALVAVGGVLGTHIEGACPACGRSDKVEIDPKFQELLDKYKDRDLGELSLGRRVYSRMNKDGVDGKNLDRVALYALYHWTLGERAAEMAVFGKNLLSDSPKDLKR